MGVHNALQKDKIEGTIETKPRENISQVENEDNSNQSDFFDNMSLYV